MTKETSDDDESSPAALEHSPCPAPIQTEETVVGQVLGETSSIENHFVRPRYSQITRAFEKKTEA
jgi:hypothetical protein